MDYEVDNLNRENAQESGLVQDPGFIESRVLPPPF